MGASTVRRAIGIVRVSQVHGREGDSFASPGTQRDRITAACQREGLELAGVHDELDVSGGTPLDAREGLRRAVEAIENGDANVLAAAYFDRLFRDLDVQREVIRRVEAAGGRVLAVDVGQITNGTAAQWLSGTLHGAMAEYVRRIAKERSGEAQARAVTRGAWMSPTVPAGYDRGPDGRLVPNADAALVREAFAARADGDAVSTVFERVRDLDLTYASVGRLLKSRAYRGEVHFGRLVNLAAHPAIVDAETWRRAQRAKAIPGRKGKSERLLARLGVLRCGSCGGRMSATTGRRGQVPLYRCGGHVGDTCPRRPTISAELVEGIVVERVRSALADVEGRASAEDTGRVAAADLERAQGDLEAAIRAFAGLADEQAAVARLAELRDARDRAQDHVDHLGASLRPAVTINADADWHRLSLDARRALIRATVDRVLVAPGRGAERRGADRVTVELVGE